MEEYKFSPIRIIVDTYEFYDNKWNLTLTHKFYGKSKEEAKKILDRHRKTDIFFDKSFTGEFEGIKLKNETYSYP